MIKVKTDQYTQLNSLKKKYALKANVVDLIETEIDILPLSFLVKMAWYMGKLMRTKTPHKRTCNVIFSPVKAPLLMTKSFKVESRQNKLSNAIVARTLK